MSPAETTGPAPTGGGRSARAPTHREQLFALTALGVIILVTIGWWMLALWPLPEDADWVLRTRAVCFGDTASGLPDAEGWSLLIGQPVSMLAVLFIGWGRATRAALARLAGSIPGRLAVACVAGALVLGAGAATVRVAEASAAARAPVLATPDALPADYPRLDESAPTALALTDQHGDRFDLAAYRGRPVLVTFAFAHCETVCPVLVREVLDAQREAPAELRPAAVVVTVDPWRDTPARLEHVAHEWGLDHDAHVLGGDIPAVLAELEAWDVEIRRDSLTGDVTHPALVYVLDRQGRIAFATTGAGEHAIDLIRRLD